MTELFSEKDLNLYLHLGIYLFYFKKIGLMVFSCTKIIFCFQIYTGLESEPPYCKYKGQVLELCLGTPE